MCFCYKFNSCKKPKEIGEFFLNIYFSEGEEIQDEEAYVNFDAKYVNPFPGEREDHLKFTIISEEDEDEVQYPADFKEALRIK